jgi:hypothetical protein
MGDILLTTKIYPDLKLSAFAAMAPNMWVVLQQMNEPTL